MTNVKIISVENINKEMIHQPPSQVISRFDSNGTFLVAIVIALKWTYKRSRNSMRVWKGHGDIRFVYI